MWGRKSRVRIAAGSSTITAVPICRVSRRVLKSIKTTRPATCMGPISATLVRIAAISTPQVVRSGTNWKMRAEAVALQAVNQMARPQKTRPRRMVRISGVLAVLSWASEAASGVGGGVAGDEQHVQR